MVVKPISITPTTVVVAIMTAAQMRYAQQGVVNVKMDGTLAVLFLIAHVKRPLNALARDACVAQQINGIAVLAQVTNIATSWHSNAEPVPQVR